MTSEDSPGVGWLGAAGRGLVRWFRTVVLELWWWLFGSARLWWRHKITATLYPLAVVIAWHVQLQFWAVVLTVPVLGIAVWARVWPVSYWDRLAGPLEDRRLKRRVRRSWPVLMESVGLTRSTPTVTRTGNGTVVPADRVAVPKLHRLRWIGADLVAWPGLLTGQTVDDVQAVTDRLRVALDAHRCRIVPNPTGTACTVVWSFADRLSRPFNATLPPAHASPVTWRRSGWGRRRTALRGCCRSGCRRSPPAVPGPGRRR